jgi:hypothetical protein
MERVWRGSCFSVHVAVIFILRTFEHVSIKSILMICIKRAFYRFFRFDIAPALHKVQTELIDFLKNLYTM